MRSKLKTHTGIFNDLLFSNGDSTDSKSTNKWHRCGTSCTLFIIHSTESDIELKIPALDLP